GKFIISITLPLVLGAIAGMITSQSIPGRYPPRIDQLSTHPIVDIWAGLDYAVPFNGYFIIRYKEAKGESFTPTGDFHLFPSIAFEFCLELHLFLLQLDWSCFG